jgi:hypothetical protein
VAVRLGEQEGEPGALPAGVGLDVPLDREELAEEADEAVEVGGGRWPYAERLRQNRSTWIPNFSTR